MRRMQTAWMGLLNILRASFKLNIMRASWIYLFAGLGVLTASFAGSAPKPRQEADAKTLIQGQCAKCHSGEKPAGGVDLSGDLASIAGLRDVVRGRPQASSLYKVVRDREMPKGGPKLSDDDLTTLRDWIMSLRPDPTALFKARCISCHSGASPAAALDLSGDLKALGKLPQAKFGDEGAATAVLYKRLADGSMPKGGTKLTDDELSSVRDWLNSLQPDPRALFTAKCVKCHGATNPAAGLDLTGDLTALAGLKQVVKGKPAGSSLYLRIADRSMPKGGPPLSDSDAGLVWDWIHSLAPPKEAGGLSQ